MLPRLSAGCSVRGGELSFLFPLSTPAPLLRAVDSASGTCADDAEPAESVRRRSRGGGAQADEGRSDVVRTFADGAGGREVPRATTIAYLRAQSQTSAELATRTNSYLRWLLGRVRDSTPAGDWRLRGLRTRLVRDILPCGCDFVLAYGNRSVRALEHYIRCGTRALATPAASDFAHGCACVHVAGEGWVHGAIEYVARDTRRDRREHCLLVKENVVTSSRGSAAADTRVSTQTSNWEGQSVRFLGVQIVHVAGNALHPTAVTAEIRIRQRGGLGAFEHRRHLIDALLTQGEVLTDEPSACDDSLYAKLQHSWAEWSS